ncbi:hypothetical protein J2128_001353 [Methanomicrobium sp. W14]|uniref:hypothetical protein n=1 Tax=Methanomicrobium sp. W14 TaxID=2817839 RepID=UPI001AEA13EC|nr:hypothetical protein [Methanomicrobium sp. W14]MBP2133399.1 hypothetical protein [Methanomicrobium sp. W14]
MGEETTKKDLLKSFKKSIQLKLYHPLKKHRFIWLIYISAVFMISFTTYMFLMLLCNLFLQTNENLSQNRIFFDGNSIYFSPFSFALGITLSIMFSTITVYFNQDEIKRLDYVNALKTLLKEIENNKNQLNKFIPIVNSRFDEYKLTKKWNWMPKQFSDTDWNEGNNFHYKYFSTTAYFYFVNLRYILLNQYFSIPKGAIANIYELSKDFNVNLQKIENLINNFDFYKERGIIDSQLNAFFVKVFGQAKTFSKPEEIMEFLKTEFYNYYAQDFEDAQLLREKGIMIFSFPPNHGLYKNYQTIYDSFCEYYDFDKEIWQTEEENKIKKEKE